MLPFEWNALRVGDRVLVHDDTDTRLKLEEGVVTDVQVLRGTTNDLGIRLGAHTVHPRRLAVHMAPLDRSYRCWRCDDVAAAA